MLRARVTGLTGRVFYGWWIALAGTVTMAMSMGLLFLGFGFFFEPMRLQFGWSRTLLSGVYSMTRVENVLMGPVEGYLIQRFGPRLVMALGFATFGLGFIALSQVNSTFTFILAFLVLALASNTGEASVMASLNNWFLRKRAKAFGLTMLGLGLAGVTFPPLLALGIGKFGWQDTALMSGLLLLAIGIPLSKIVRHSPEPYGYLPDGDQPSSRSASLLSTDRPAEPSEWQSDAQGEYDFTLQEALRTRAFWVLCLGHALCQVVISTVTIHQVPFLEVDLAFSKTSAAAVVMVMSGMTTLGQVIGGFIGDRFPKYHIVAVTILGHSGALLLLSTADSFVGVVLSAALQGLSWGIRAPIVVAMRGDFFGRRSYAVIAGFIRSVTTVGFVVGPLITGYLADEFNYSVAFKVVAVCVLPGALLFFTLRSPQPGA